MDTYVEIMFSSSWPKRWQREMMAVVVSKANNCHYCILHSPETLKYYLNDTDISGRILNYPERLLDNPQNESHFAYTLMQITEDYNKKVFTWKL